MYVDRRITLMRALIDIWGNPTYHLAMYNTRRRIQEKFQSYINQTILYPEQGRIGYHTPAQTFDGG